MPIGSVAASWHPIGSQNASWAARGAQPNFFFLNSSIACCNNCFLFKRTYFQNGDVYYFFIYKYGHNIFSQKIANISIKLNIYILELRKQLKFIKIKSAGNSKFPGFSRFQNREFPGIFLAHFPVFPGFYFPVVKPYYRWVHGLLLCTIYQ